MCIILNYSFHKRVCTPTPYNWAGRTEKIEGEERKKNEREKKGCSW